MKVLMLRGNPRKNGVTERLADLFARGLRESGAQVESEPGNGARQRGPKTELQKASA